MTAARRASVAVWVARSAMSFAPAAAAAVNFSADAARRAS
jgi:hypothetical protein